MGNDSGTGVTTDSSGRIFVCGHTESQDFTPVNGLMPYQGAWDAFVTEIRAQNVYFSTYLGGVLGDVADTIHVDSGGCTSSGPRSRARRRTTSS